MTADDIALARRALAQIGGDAIERQIFLCAMSDKQSCCSREAGEASWTFLKRRLRELGLVFLSSGTGHDESVADGDRDQSDEAGRKR